MLHTLIVSRAFAKGAGSCRMQLSEGQAKDFRNGSCSIFSLVTIDAWLGSGGSMADVQVVHLVFAIPS